MDRRSIWANAHGGVAVISAFGAALACLAAAIAVDLGALALHARKVQGAADLAALAAAQRLDGADAAARTTVALNLTNVRVIGTETGRYVPDPARKPADRFEAGASEIDAARVTVTAKAPVYFSRWLLGRDEVLVTRQATAAAPQTPKAMISLGSRLARLDGGVANQVLSGLLGSQVSLSVMDYRALADLDVNLLQFSDALATKAGVTVGDYDHLLATQVDAGDALGVVKALAGGRDGGALGRLTAAAAGLDLKVDRLIGAEVDARQGLREGLDAQVSALDLVMAIAEIAGGDRQIDLKLGAQAGVADLKATLAIGERPNTSPWIAVTARGDPVLRTAQARLYLRTRTAQSLSGLAQINLPILIELAPAEARLERLSCTPARSVRVLARPGLARAMVGAVDETRLDDFQTPVVPVKATLAAVLGVVTVKGKADIEVADVAPQSIVFSADDIAQRRIKTVKSRNLATGLVTTLLQRLELDVIGLPLGGLASAVGNLLAPLGPVLDGAISPILDVLGLKLGEADISVLGLSCPDTGRAPPRLVG
ncbi:TadG family pilus assembly protein [Brevundimonas sp. G8]|uniref:TadG family pilus assembly protein n=1 Tax=Brevundimonas sp. G8 TaxID=1350776 RepID=UPI0012EFF81C|nr:TadG family pilus assembly protein [Brevundimonas sp. G8]VXB09125.1 conserved hypothetical protein [Brevundimonas sp. G8]